MHRGSLPCSAITFVRNGGAAFERCLSSCLHCAEHVVLDGGSSDETVKLAASYGCTILPQDERFLDAAGRIIDFSGVMNQGIAIAQYPWILKLDADEYLSPALIASIRTTVERGEPGAFLFLRQPIVYGRLIEHESFGPTTQIRLLHTNVFDGFGKIVHEKPKLHPGVQPQLLPGIQYVPIDSTPRQLRQKYRQYLMLEERARNVHTWGAWLRIIWNRGIRIVYWLLRIVWVHARHRPSRCLPLGYEWLNLWYAWRVIVITFPLRHS